MKLGLVVLSRSMRSTADGIPDSLGLVHNHVGMTYLRAYVSPEAEFSQVSVGLDAAAGIDGNDVELVLQFVVKNSAHYLAADTAVTVDGNFDTHGFSSSFGFGLWIEWRQL